MSGAALAALLLGGAGIGGLVSAIVGAWVQKRNVARDDRREDREDEKADVEELRAIIAEQRELNTQQKLFVDRARVEMAQLFATVEKLEGEVAQLRDAHADCNERLEAAHARIEELSR